MPTTSKTASKRVVAADRRAKILELRKAGWTLAEIGKEMHIHPTRVHALLKDILKKLNDKMVDELQETITIEESRIDELLKAVWPKAKDGDVKATEMVLRLMERRARLRGLDRVEPSQRVKFDQTSDAELLEQARLFGFNLSDELSRQLESSVAKPREVRKGALDVGLSESERAVGNTNESSAG